MAGIRVSFMRNGRSRNSTEEEILDNNLMKKAIQMLGHILSGSCRLAPKLLKAAAVGTGNVMTKGAAILTVRMYSHVWYFTALLH